MMHMHVAHNKIIFDIIKRIKMRVCSPITIVSSLRKRFLLRWLRGLFDNANKTETGSSFDVIFVLSKYEGLWSFNFEFYAMRSNTLLSCDL